MGQPFATLSFLFIFLLTIVVYLPNFCDSAPGSDKDWSLPYDNTFNNENKFKTNWDHSGFFGENYNIRKSTREEDETRNIAEMATKTIVAIVIFLVLASFVAFLICLCCPICILAKMRQRRRGFVYQTAATNGASTTVQTNGQTVTVVNTVTRNANPNSPPHSSNATSSPYPVQQAAPIQQYPHPTGGPPYPNQVPYPTGPTGMPMPMPSSGPPVPPPTDLPPPYPGLPREVDNLSQQPPFNPYFSENQDAPNPYMATTAPYPTK